MGANFLHCAGILFEERDQTLDGASLHGVLSASPGTFLEVPVCLAPGEAPLLRLFPTSAVDLEKSADLAHDNRAVRA